MSINLLDDILPLIDSHELRLFFDEHIPGPGQYDGNPANVNRLHLPLADASCRLVLAYNGGDIVSVEAGSAFDGTWWTGVRAALEVSLLAGPVVVGRDYSFSSYRVLGSWRGTHSGVQILPPADSAPRCPVEMGDHPFILEFPIQRSDLWAVTNFRRQREYRNFTLLLNLLLVGRTSVQDRNPNHRWGAVPDEGLSGQVKWFQPFFFADLGDVVIDAPSASATQTLSMIAPEVYYATRGHDGRGREVPANLDQSICCYTGLSGPNRSRFNRAMFWLDLASQQWNTSISASFASLVSAVEALAGPGNRHRIRCPDCGEETTHETPGATRRFRDFFDRYASGDTLAGRRNDMYSLRSRILHGSVLMQSDGARTFGWDPPSWDQRELHGELWGLTRIALRNWLTSPPAD